MEFANFDRGYLQSAIAAERLLAIAQQLLQTATLNASHPKEASG